MSFADFTPTAPLPATVRWANEVQEATQNTLLNVFTTVKTTYEAMWLDRQTVPQNAIERIAALGTGAAAAFQAHAISVNYLLSILPLFKGTADMIAQAQTWQIPAGWQIAFNPDGSATATPPQS